MLGRPLNPVTAAFLLPRIFIPRQARPPTVPDASLPVDCSRLRVHALFTELTAS